MSRRHVEIEILSRHCVYVRGYLGREALLAVAGKAPVWSSRARAWVCSERTARQRLLPHLEHLGVDVTVIDPRAAQSIDRDRGESANGVSKFLLGREGGSEAGAAAGHRDGDQPNPAGVASDEAGGLW